MSKESQEKSLKKTKNVQFKFNADQEMKNRIDELMASEGYEFSHVTRSLLEVFLNLSGQDRKKLLAFAEVLELLRRNPDLLDYYQAGIQPLLDAAVLKATSGNSARQTRDKE